MARAPIDRVRRPLADALPSAAGRLPSSRAEGRDHRRRAPARPARAHPLLGLLHSLTRALSRQRRVRIALLVCLVSLPLLLGGWSWLRNSSLVSVRHVHVTGVQGPDAQAIEAALSAAARHMSTLD